MKIQDFGIPKPGMRNIKTAVSVFICLIIYRFLGKPYPIYACIAAVICTKDTIWNSYSASRSRLIGTVMGGIIGGLFLKLVQEIYFFLSFEIITVLGIIILIYIMNLIKEKDSAALACVVYILLMINFQYNWEMKAPFKYAFERTIETALGVTVSLIINRYVFQYKVKVKERKTLKIDYKTSLYGLIGDPIEKSLSPDIHNLSFSNNSENGVYLAFQVKKNELKNAVESIKALKIKGFNVTIPHKVEIIKYLDELDFEAETLGAVNTVKNENGKLKGYNTDGRGFIELLNQNNFIPIGKEILVIGAGGAARAIVMLLAKEKAKKIVILNRTEKKAVELKEEVGKLFKETIIDVKVDDYKKFDLVINTTSVGMHPNIEDIPMEVKLLDENCVVCDIIYKPLETKLLKEAESRGLKTIKGLGMLINQALLSEEIWLNRKIIREDIEEKLSKIIEEQ